MPSLQDIRAKFPEYGDMDDETFAERYRTKYYSDMPAEEYRSKLGMRPLPAPSQSANPAQRMPPEQLATRTPGNQVLTEPHEDFNGPLKPAVGPRPLREVKEETVAGGKMALRGLADTALGIGGVVLGPITAAARAIGNVRIAPSASESFAQYKKGLAEQVVGGSAVAAAPLRAAAAGIFEGVEAGIESGWLPKEGAPNLDVEAWHRAKDAADWFPLIVAGMSTKPSASTIEKAGKAEKAANSPKVIVGPGGNAIATVTTSPIANPVTQAVRSGEVTGTVGKATAVHGPGGTVTPVPQPDRMLLPKNVEASTVPNTAKYGIPEEARKFAGNINLDRINSEDGVKAALYNLSEFHAGSLDAARRGKVTFEETREAANALGMTVDDLVARRQGQAFNAEEALAARDLLLMSTDDLVRSARNVGPGSYAEFAEKYARHLTIQEQVAGITAEAGRALAQFRILSKMGLKAKGINQLVKNAGGAEKIEDLASLIAQHADDPGVVAGLVRDAPKATTSDKLFYIYINLLLSAPKTHAANISGNVASTGVNLVEGAIAEGIGRMAGEGVAAGETAARAGGLLSAMKEGTLAFAKTAWRGTAESKMVEQVRPEAFPFLSGRAGSWTPTRMLSAEDAFFRTIIQRTETNALAVRTATGEGLKGPALAQRIEALKANPTVEMIEAAGKAADYGTFTKSLGEAGKATQLLIKAVPGMRWIAPFVRTPINLFKYAGERIPGANLISPKVRADLAGTNGPVAQQMAIARNVTGAAMVGTAALLWGEGKITGPGPSYTDPQRKVWLVDHAPYSFKVGDQWVSYSRIEPFATIFGSVAGALDVWKDNDVSDDEKDYFVTSVITGAIENMSSKTFVSGPIAALEAIMDPERAGPKYLQRMASSIVPTLSAHLAQADDPIMRENRTLHQAFANRIPGMKADLPPKIDIFGREIDTAGPMNSVEQFVSPFPRKMATEDPVAREMARVGYAPPYLQRTLRNKGEARVLDDKEFETYQRNVGTMMYSEFQKMINHPVWQELSDDEKKDEMTKLRNEIAAEARKLHK